MSDAPERTTDRPSQPSAPAAPPNEQSFFSTLLAPGSSLHPTLLLLLDAAFLALFLLFLSLAIATEGNVHILALMGIEVALWASVKWFVSELRKVQAAEGGSPAVLASSGDEATTKPKQE